ncbi:conserved phage C-terminal domain-containing protein (plasmid) [Lysinibacillus capsici]|uniref:conserved phage C-terminal domain-containing protein n=1 Tax=Lysinibacillus capsici TaxID=2115968 RepID=UPI0021DB2859|nr:conserved phage C-terminal domain-containing protein [Lysinibacillus capsici]UYB50412.1 conserved phage C-terminal domain-containing protein [Lysinibacillus capsici]
MNLLINEPPLQVLPSLAVKVGLNEAIILQQLHYRLLISTNIHDGHKWVFNTYQQWHKEFPFLSERTIQRVFRDLESDGYIYSTDKYNKFRADKTKWYRIDYSKLGYEGSCQFGISNTPNWQVDNDKLSCPDDANLSGLDTANLAPAITKDIKSNKNNNVELSLNVEIINYLNQKANKHFKPNSTATKKLINARLRDGYTEEQFKQVIDLKVKQWSNNPDMQNYLRPSTLFNATNFENYCNEVPVKQSSNTPVQTAKLQRPQLNFGVDDE